MRLIEGGLPAPGEVVMVGGKKATVVHAAFSTAVFRGDVSVRFDDGTLELLPLENVERVSGP